MAHTKYYNKHGKEVPSVTTVLKILNKPALIGWANYLGFKRQKVDDVLESSAHIGTSVHFLIECDIMGYGSVLSTGRKNCKSSIMRRYNNYLKWKNTVKISPIFMERALSSSTFGGTVDFYGYLDDRLTIIDFKTSKAFRMSMFIQLAGYVLLVEEAGYKVERVAILLVGEKEIKLKTMRREKLDRYVTVFKTMVYLYYHYGSLSQDDGWGEDIGK